MRPILVVVGVLIVLMGVIWALQGLGVIPGSFMSNSPPWIGIGAATAVVGVVLSIAGIRSGPLAKNPRWPSSRHEEGNRVVARGAIGEGRRGAGFLRRICA